MYFGKRQHWILIYLCFSITVFWQSILISYYSILSIPTMIVLVQDGRSIALISRFIFLPQASTLSIYCVYFCANHFLEAILNHTTPYLKSFSNFPMPYEQKKIFSVCYLRPFSMDSTSLFSHPFLHSTVFTRCCS